MLLKDEHIFTIKTKDALNVAAIKAGGANVTISGLNVLREQIKLGNLVFVVFGGDKPLWATGFVGMAVISREPYDDGYDAKNKKNFKVDIDVKVYFDPPLTRTDLVSYPDTFDTIGIGPITKWEPNQAITSVGIKNAIGLFQATCDLRPNVDATIRHFLGAEATILDRAIKRFVLTTSNLGDNTIDSDPLKGRHIDLRADFIAWAPNKKPGRNGKAASADTIKKYIGYLACLTKPMETHGTTAGWNGLYEFLHGRKPPLYYYEIDTKDRLNDVYGFLHSVFDGGTIPEGVNAANFATVQSYFNDKEMKKHACLPSAYEAYEEFLEWREVQLKSRKSVIASADLLSIVLRAFAAARKEEAWCAEKVGGDATKPGMGWRANGAMRKSLPMTNNLNSDKQVADWFKDLAWPDGKAWLEGVDTPGCAAWGSTIDGLVKGGAAATGSGGQGATALPGRIAAAVRAVAHPDTECFYDANVFDALKFLGLADGAFSEDFADDDYAVAKGAQAVLKRRLKDIGEKCAVEWDAAATPPCAKPDTAPPDYLTVNEFLWWVKENQKEISKECEVKKMKAADKNKVANPPQGEKPKVNLANAEEVVLLRLAAALRTKPFAILAGHSGTGKSRMVRQLAYMTCAKGGYKALLEDAEGKPRATPGNFCMVQVKPNWHDSTDLLGYYSELKEGFKGTEFTKFLCTAYAYPDVPFFVCLDEMNLAPVEQYFAEYLSAIESRKIIDNDVVTDPLLAKEAWQNKVGAQDYSGLGCELTESQTWLDKHGLTIPRNLFVVGTVNMDESTNQFSRKVLDRAFTIEMTDADFENFGSKNPEPKFEDYAGDAFVQALMAGEVTATKPEASAPQAEKDAFAKAIGNLESIKPVLAGTSFVVAYRFANEYLLYAKSLEEMKAVFDISPKAPAAASAAAAPAAGSDASQPPAADGSSAPAPAAGGGSAPAPAEASKVMQCNAFDDMVLMKVLPRISGESEMVMKIFAGKVKADAEQKDMWPQIEDAAKAGGEGKGLAGLLGVDSSCVAKMREIVERGESGGSGTLTFWP